MDKIKVDGITREHVGTVEVKAGRVFLLGRHESLMSAVSFVPGLGNGAYDVYAESKHIPGYGDRITKVEIECISEEEIRFLEREYSDVHIQ